MATYYIDPSGNDSTGNGSSGNPWKTFAKFLSASTNNDICNANAGTYTWATATLTDRTLQATVAQSSVIFDAASADVRWTMAGTDTIDGITFTGLDTVATNHGNFAIQDSSVLVWQNCIFHDNKIFGAADQSEGFWGHANFGDTSTVTIQRNVFYNMSEDNTSSGGCPLMGLRLLHGTLSWYANTFYDNSTGTGHIVTLIAPYQADFAINFVDNIIMANNSAIAFWGYAPGTIVTINCKTNDFYNITGAPCGTGNITGDPLFADAANANFRLRPTSPCRGTGTLI